MTAAERQYNSCANKIAFYHLCLNRCRSYAQREAYKDAIAALKAKRKRLRLLLLVRSIDHPTASFLERPQS